MPEDRAIHVGVLTISDRAARGVYADQSGPAVQRAVELRGWRVVARSIVPDDKAAIQRALRDQMAQGCDLILTTGGTGITPRDVTPEAVREMARRELPGFGEAMRMGSFKANKHAILSRSLAVEVDQTLVICLPGKPSGAVECLNIVADAVPHGLEMLRDLPNRH